MDHEHLYTITPPPIRKTEEVIVNLGHIAGIGHSMYLSALNPHYTGFVVDLIDSNEEMVGALVYIPCYDDSYINSELEETRAVPITTEQVTVTYRDLEVKCDPHIAELIDDISKSKSDHGYNGQVMLSDELIDRMILELLELQRRNNNQYEVLQSVDSEEQ